MRYTKAQIEKVLEEVRMKYTQEQINEYRAMWLTQLRSPEAKQWTGELESLNWPEKRCCLGHACHALQAERSYTDCYVYYGSDNDVESSTLPYSVAEKLNITNDGEMINCYVHGNDVYGELTKLNDSGVFSLSEIADIIEEGFKKNNFHSYDGKNND